MRWWLIVYVVLILHIFQVGNLLGMAEGHKSIFATNHGSALVRVLKQITDSPMAIVTLGLRGEIASILFYGLPRPSVHLEFDLLDSSKDKHIFELIKQIVSDFGILKEVRNCKDRLIFLLSYGRNKNDACDIGIIVNKLNGGSRYEIKQYLGITFFVMVQEDLVAHKIADIFERMGTANHDIFDACYLLQKNAPVNKIIVEQRTGLSYKAVLQKCIDELNEASEHSVLVGIGGLSAQQIAWSKKNLRSEMVFLLNLLLANE